MLDMKHFYLGKEEYVVLKKDTLEEILYTAVTLTGMCDANAHNLANGYGDTDFSISEITVGEVDLFASKHIVTYRTIVDKILENLKGP